MGRFSQEVSPREMLQGFDLWIHGVLGGDRAHRFIKNSSRFISTLATEVQAAASVASRPEGSAPMGSVAMRLALVVSVWNRWRLRSSSVVREVNSSVEAGRWRHCWNPL